MTAASQGLDDFLPSALMDATENLRHLQDSKLAREVTEAAAEKFCLAFEHVEEILTDSTSAYDAPIKGHEPDHSSAVYRVVG